MEPFWVSILSPQVNSDCISHLIYLIFTGLLFFFVPLTGTREFKSESEAPLVLLDSHSSISDFENSLLRITGKLVKNAGYQPCTRTWENRTQTPAKPRMVNIRITVLPVLLLLSLLLFLGWTQALRRFLVPAYCWQGEKAEELIHSELWFCSPVGLVSDAGSWYLYLQASFINVLIM